jgi:peptide/nickel transport system permease protein
VIAIFVLYATLRIAPAPLGLISPLLDMPPRVTGIPLVDAALGGDVRVFFSMVEHLWLPVLILVISCLPVVLKVLVVALDEAVTSQPIRFRVALGQSPARVIRAALRHAMPTTIVSVTNLTLILLGGTIVVEQLFSMGGMGQYAIEGVVAADTAIVQGFLIIYAGICLTAFLLSDFAVLLVDPRRRSGRTGGA